MERRNNDECAAFTCVQHKTFLKIMMNIVSANSLVGSYPALVTPFNNGRPDWAALENLVNFHVAQGSAGLVVCGTTGESPTLSHKEHIEIVGKAVMYTNGRFPVIAGAGSNSTQEAIELSQAAQDVGASGLLHVTGYYNKPNNQQVIEHFRMLDRATSLPIILYDIPTRTGLELSVSAIEQISQFENVVGIKDSTSNVSKVSLERLTIKKSFAYLSGDDLTSLGYMAHGGTGWISVTANVEPKLCSEMMSAALRGDYQTARDIQDRLMPLYAAIFLEPSPAGIKYAMSKRGLCSEELRLPLSQVSEETKFLIDKALEFARRDEENFQGDGHRFVLS
jgi:4-hydroxy-tetrahydrodipicolinate synthase